MQPKKKWYYNLFRRRMLVIGVLALQMAVFIYILVSNSMASQMVASVLNIVSVGAALYIISLDTPPAFRTIWICLVLAFPVFGGLLYIFFAFQSSTRRFSKLLLLKDKRRKDHATRDSGLLEVLKSRPNFDSSVATYLEGYCGFPIYDGTEAEYYPIGEDFHKALLKELEKAEKYIFLEFFIIEEGEMWNSILEILERKAAQGVEVRILYDDMGCFVTLPKEYPKILAKKGLKVHVFNPFIPVLSSIQNNRDHRKIVSIDGKVAFTGGINLADEYINKIEKHGHWKDTGIRISGKAAWSLTLIFLSMWGLYSKEDEDYAPLYPQSLILPQAGGLGYVQPYADSPMDKEYVAEQVYLKIIQRASDYVYITTPYLIINENLQSALCLAAKSGVDVRIITPHIADKKLVHRTTRSYYATLRDAGVKIYEYTPGFIHSKTLLCDGKVATVGTANLDYRSLNLHFECGTCIYENPTVTKAMEKDFLETQEKSHLITAEDCKKYAKFGRLLNRLLRLFAPLM